jgi:hypothetical protein
MIILTLSACEAIYCIGYNCQIESVYGLGKSNATSSNRLRGVKAIRVVPNEFQNRPASPYALQRLCRLLVAWHPSLRGRLNG